jgi:HEAT repeat protein
LLNLVGTDPKIVFAFWLGVAVAVMTLLMLAVIIVMRQIVLHRERVHARALAFWKTVLAPAAGSEVAAIPPLPDRDLSGFLEAWNEVHEPLRGETTPHLARVAGEVGLEQRLYRRLTHRSFHTRLVAIIALGHVRNIESFRHVEGFIDDKNPIVSLCAARALMQIDPPRAVSKFVPQIVRRSDWSQGSIASILSEVGADNVTRELSEATLQANAEIAPRLIRFLASVNPDAAAPIIRNTLLSSADERLISTCLQVMSKREDLDCVRPLLAHPRWHVRMQAAVTLGRLGVPGDEQRLIAILSDEQWWVRYRAAQALTHLSFITREDMLRIERAQTDKYAKDIIEHVLAEQAMSAAA